MSHHSNNVYCVSDSSIKNILYEIPNNLTKVNAASSYCTENKSLLIVNWSNGNQFEVAFNKNNKSYELSKFYITINVTDVLKDSSGKIFNKKHKKRNNNYKLILKIIVPSRLCMNV